MISEIERVYHYCSVDTFLKIISTGTIFLTHSRMLNDGKEDRLFLESMSEKRMENMYKGAELEVAKKIIKLYTEKVDFPYVACFSKKDDILSQWIAYGDDGKGVAIGFDLTKIPYIDLLNTQHREKTQIMVDEIEYSDNEEELIDKIIRAAIINYHKDDDKNKAIISAINLIENLSIFCKSTYFRAEEEVRMVYRPCYRKMLEKLNGESIKCDNLLQMGFISNDVGIKSYFKYILPEDAIVSITLGPKNEIDYVQLTMLLSQYAPRVRIENNISRSKIYYK